MSFRANLSLGWQGASTNRGAIVTDKVRTLIAEYLYVDMGSVTDETHFADDLGADWVDCVDLMLAIEDEFAGVQIADEDLDRIVTVGDLIRYIEAAVCLAPKRKRFANPR